MKHFEIIDTQAVHDAQVVVVRTSTPIHGIGFPTLAFLVHDLDGCERSDPTTGKMFIKVLCAEGSQSYSEDSTIELDVSSLEACVVGFEGDVVRHLRLVEGCI